MAEDPNNQRQEFGPIVGVVIIVALLVIGGIYFFLMQEERVNEEPALPQETSA